jgi:hypothetical protein
MSQMLAPACPHRLCASAAATVPPPPESTSPSWATTLPAGSSRTVGFRRTLHPAGHRVGFSLSPSQAQTTPCSKRAWNGPPTRARSATSPGFQPFDHNGYALVSLGPDPEEVQPDPRRRSVARTATHRDNTRLSEHRRTPVRRVAVGRSFQRCTWRLNLAPLVTASGTDDAITAHIRGATVRLTSPTTRTVRRMIAGRAL